MSQNFVAKDKDKDKDKDKKHKKHHKDKDHDKDHEKDKDKDKLELVSRYPDTIKRLQSIRVRVARGQSAGRLRHSPKRPKDVGRLVTARKQTGLPAADER